MPLNRFIFLGLLAFLMLFANRAQACDTTPVLTPSNVQPAGGGNYTVDLQVCMGINGSTNGFSATIGCGLNIVSTSAPTISNGPRTASASISGGTITYNCASCNASNWFEPNDFTAGPCFNFTLTVNGDPTGCPVTVTGVNDGCLIIQTSWSTNVPGPCVNAGSITAPASFPGNTSTSFSGCNLRPSNDQVIQVNLPCSDLWTFSLCGSASWDTYMYVGSGCCTNNYGINDDACGLQSQVTTTIGPGTVYVTIEGFGSSSQGAYTLAVTGSNGCPLDAGDIRLLATPNDAENTVDLAWTVENEVNVAGYYLERSIENGPFTTVEMLEPKGVGANGFTEYTVQDWQVKAGELYRYRVHVHTIGGEFYESETVTAMLGTPDGLSAGAFFPNPASEKAKIELRSNQEGTLNAQIHDTRGRVVAVRTMSVHAGMGISSLNISDLPAGLYFVQMTDQFNQSVMRKLVVE